MRTGNANAGRGSVGRTFVFALFGIGVGACLGQEVGELPAKYRHWLENEVGLIITSAERDVFLGLTSDSSRERFVREFWENRDPSPGTFTNEYREEFERRRRAVDTLFGVGRRPGWTTDRGRIHLLLGPPDQIDRLPTSRNFYPIEIWYYNQVPSAGIYHPLNLLFFKRWGVGNYVLYSPSLDGVNALLTPTQSHRFVVMPNDVATRQMLEENLELSPSEIPVVNAAIYVGPGVTGAGAEAVLARAQSPPAVNLSYLDRYLGGAVEAEVFFRSVPFHASTHVFRNPGGGSIIELAIELPPNALPFEQVGQDYYLRLEVTGELKNRDGMRVDGFESPVQIQFTAEEVEAHRFLPLLYQRRLFQLGGEYTLDLTVRTPATRAASHQSLRLYVPRASTDKMQLSSLLLSYDPDEPESALEPRPFLRNTQLILPRVDGRFRQGSRAHVYYELYLPERHEGQNPMRAEYLVLRGEDVVHRQAVTLREPEDGVLPVLYPLPLEGLEPGGYVLAVQVTDEERGQSVVSEADFEVTDEFQIRGRINAVITDNLNSTEVETKLGTYWLGTGNLQRAREHFEKAYRNEPSRTLTRVNLARILALQGENTIARDLLNAALAQDPGNVEALLALAYAQFRLGEQDRAIASYERALSIDQTDLAWNGLAELYLSVGERDKALRCMERSLEVNPDQPEIVRKLRELQKQTEK